jgi:hypothetical protein
MSLPSYQLALAGAQTTKRLMPDMLSPAMMRAMVIIRNRMLTPQMRNGTAQARLAPHNPRPAHIRFGFIPNGIASASTSLLHRHDFSPCCGRAHTRALAQTYLR